MKRRKTQMQDDDEDEVINPEIEEIIDYQEKLKQETRE